MKTTDREDELLAVVRSATDDMRLSPEARDRIERRLRRGAAGATTLRGVETRWRRRAGWASAAAAAAVIAIVWIVPAVDRETTISAAEVLGRSQQALAAPATGVETLTYDLTLGGVLEQWLPAGQAGSFVVAETIDHDHPGRFRVLKLAPDGQVAAGVASDPLKRTRVHYLRLEGRGLMLQTTDASGPALSILELKRSVLRALIAMMATSDSKSLREIERGGEPAYEVDVPVASDAAGILTLQRARIVVDRQTSRLLDFDASGMVASQPFAITFALRSADTHPSGSVAPGTFTIEPAAGDEIVDAASGSSVPLWDLLDRCLRR